jgi:import receptor subunit TOM70
MSIEVMKCLFNFRSWVAIIKTLILSGAGLLQLQSTGNVELATKHIEEAIRMDNKCEFAYETLGTIEVQRGNLRRAIELFDQAIPLSKTEAEVSHLFSLKDAALAQLKVALNLGVTLPSAMN